MRVYVLCLDRTPALPTVAHLAHFNLDVTKSRREQAIRQCLRRNRVAGVAEMHFKYWYKGNYWTSRCEFAPVSCLGQNGTCNMLT